MKNLIAFILTIFSLANAIDTATGEYTAVEGSPPDAANNACRELNLDWVGGEGRSGSDFNNPGYAILQGGSSGESTDHAECGLMYQFGNEPYIFYSVVTSYSDTADDQIYLNPSQCYWAPRVDHCVTPVELTLLPRVSGTYTLDSDGQPEEVTVCEGYENIDWTEVNEGDSLANAKYAVVLVVTKAADCGKIFETYSQKNQETNKYVAIIGYRHTVEADLIGSYLLNNSDCDSCDLSSLIFVGKTENVLPIPMLPTVPVDTTEGPDGTTEGPDDTTEGPDDTTEGPDGTTEGPDGTTEGPDGTTEGPDDTTEGPDGTTKDRDGTTKDRDGSTKSRCTKVSDSGVTTADMNFWVAGMLLGASVASY